MKFNFSDKERMERYKKALEKISEGGSAWKMRLIAKKCLNTDMTYEAYFYKLLQKYFNFLKTHKTQVYVVGGIKFQFWHDCVWGYKKGKALLHVCNDIDRMCLDTIEISISNNISDEIIVFIDNEMSSHKEKCKV